MWGLPSLQKEDFVTDFSFFSYTMGQNREKHRKNSHLIIHSSTSKGVSEVSEQANEQIDKRVAQDFSLYSWLFWSIVSWQTRD